MRPSGLAGACLGAAVIAAQPGANGTPGLIVGWLYGVLVAALVRLFRIPPRAYPLAGFLVGPLPFALLMSPSATSDERGVLWLGFLAGLLIGLMEWAAARFVAASGPPSLPPQPLDEV
jgi:hypothetical protein